MKINRVSEEKLAPSWAFEDVSREGCLDEKFLSEEEMQRIENLPFEDLTDEGIVEERDTIERCAESGSLYHYNAQWSDKTKRALREYAEVSGMKMDKFRAVHPEYIENIRLVEREAANAREKMFQKVANKEIDSMLEDPFKLDERANTDHMKPTNWEDNKKQINLEDRPSMMSGAVKPLRGGEDYFEDPISKLADGQNSILDPGAIESLANSEVEDTGERLRRENEERAASREAKHKEWEQDKIDAMEKSEIIPKGSVFPTEAMNAQPGIKGDLFDFDKVPDKTAGEKIAEGNEEHRKEIQGEDKEEHEFTLKSASVRGISDTFGSELEKALKKHENS